MRNLQPIEQRHVSYLGETIPAILAQDSQGHKAVYIPLRPFVERLGLNWVSQKRRVKKNTVLSKVCASIPILAEGDGAGEPAKVSEALCLPMSHLNGFLLSINVNRLNPEIRPLMVSYQKKCYAVLAQAFNGSAASRRFYMSGEGGDAVDGHLPDTPLYDAWLREDVPPDQKEALQDDLNKEAFGMTLAQHRHLKQLPEEADLKSNMSRMEFLLSQVANEAARELIEKAEKAGEEIDYRAIAKRAGGAAGKMRRFYEEEVGLTVVTDKTQSFEKRPLLGGE